MDKAKIIDALANASIYTISGAVFIEKIVAAGVKSYQIDINEFELTFKGKEAMAFDNPLVADQTISVSLLRKEGQSLHLVVQALKRAGVSSYEVFLPEMRMIFYEKDGEVVNGIYGLPSQ